MSPDSLAVRRLVLRRFLPVLLLIVAAIGLFPVASFADEGYATWYGEPFNGRHMANGQIYDMYDPTTTASNLYPFGTWIKVTNPANGRTVVVQVRDRGAFTHALDLSYAAFASIEDPARMYIRVVYEVVSGPDGGPVASPPPAPVATPAPTPAAVPPPAPVPASAPAPAKTVSPEEYVVIPGDTLLAIARHFGVDAATLAKWNNLSDANSIAIGQHIKLTGSAATDTAAASTRGAAAGDITNPYTIAAGDTLWGIALRYGTTPEQLVALNNLGTDALIVIGRSIRVPPAPSSVSTAASAPAVSGPARSDSTVVVQPGDTLWGIAQHYGTTPVQLAALNNLGSDGLIVIGQSLRVTAAAASSGTVASAPTASGNTVVVRQGDTLWGLALRFDASPEQLSALNNLGQDAVIVIGQTLRLPSASVSTLVVNASANVATSGGNTVVVQPGDTLLAIALRQGSTVADLVSANGLADSNLIQPGQTLLIP